MSKAPIPVVLWVLWALTVAAYVLPFTAWRDAAFPVAVVSFFGMFFSMVSSWSKGAVRLRIVQNVSILSSATAMVVGVAASSWGNVWLALVPAASGYAVITRYLLYRKMTYTRAPWLEILIIVAGFASYAIGNLSAAGLTGWWALGLFIPWGLFGFEATLFRNLKMMRIAKRALGVGDTAPDFALQSQHGEAVSLSDFRGERPVLLFFVRGDWCPACHIMLRAYQTNRAKFADKGVAVLAIGPDPTNTNAEISDTLGLEYGLLSDVGMKTAKSYRLLIEGRQAGLPYAEGMPVPTSFLIDTEGVIRFTSAANRVGEILEPEAIFEVLEQLPKA